jgi:hypothetical protein
MLPAGDFNILDRNIFDMGKKVKKIAIFRYPLALKVGQMAPIFGL